MFLIKVSTLYHFRIAHSQRYLAIVIFIGCKGQYTGVAVSLRSVYVLLPGILCFHVAMFRHDRWWRPYHIVLRWAWSSGWGVHMSTGDRGSTGTRYTRWRHHALVREGLYTREIGGIATKLWGGAATHWWYTHCNIEYRTVRIEREVTRSDAQSAY